MSKALVFFLELLIKGYQNIISPIIGPRCRFYPTCSEYAKQSIKKHGSLKGIKLTLKRIIKCHPWGTSGKDLVP